MNFPQGTHWRFSCENLRHFFSYIVYESSTNSAFWLMKKCLEITQKTAKQLH